MTTPQKDVVYIDVEDDITAIIGKLKSSSREIVALVPPKRIGVLQSAVNLRLLARAAKQSKKQLVIITGNSSLSSLAAAAQIPVAATLQSKPELAEIAALDIDNGDDVIDGSDLPIGDHASQSEESMEHVTEPASAATSSALAAAKVSKPAAAAKKTAKPSKSAKVPNFDTFRKKLVFGVIGLVAAIGFLIWAIVFAPHATIVMSAETTDAEVTQQVTLSDSAELSVDNSILPIETEQITREVSTEFQATGKKDVGEYATGTVEFSTRDIERLGSTIPAGTTLSTSSGASYETDSAVTFTLENFRGASTGITATERGTNSNGASGSVSGAPSGVNAEITETTSGGTDKTVPVVKESDIAAARKKIEQDAKNDDQKSALTKKFDASAMIILDETYRVDTGGISSNIAAGDEAKGGKATLSGTIKYTLSAVARSDVDGYLKEVVATKIDDKNAQKVYSSGIADVQFSDISKADEGWRAQLETTGKIGPKINEDDIKQRSHGKNFGEVQEDLKSIDGIRDVEVKFSPFWVRSVPSDNDKITIDFGIDGND